MIHDDIMMSTVHTYLKLRATIYGFLAQHCLCNIIIINNGDGDSDINDDAASPHNIIMGFALKKIL